APQGGHFALTLDGFQSGYIKSLDGGDITAEVIAETVSSSYFAKKRIGQPKYEDFVMQLDLSMENRAYEWITASWTGRFQRKNGSFTTYDSSGSPAGEQDFFNTLITETAIPALDSESHDEGYLTVKLSPEYTRVKVGTGAAPTIGKAPRS